jgi:hypothetical protein
MASPWYFSQADGSADGCADGCASEGEAEKTGKGQKCRE